MKPRRLTATLLSILCVFVQPASASTYRLEYALIKQWEPQEQRVDVRLSRFDLPTPRIVLKPGSTITELTQTLERIERAHPGSLVSKGSLIMELDSTPLHAVIFKEDMQDQPPLYLDISAGRFIETHWRLQADGTHSYLRVFRRTRARTINYIDHPQLGLIFGLWPVEHANQNKDKTS